MKNVFDDMEKVRSRMNNYFKRNNRKNGGYRAYNLSTLDDLVDELDNPAKQERVLADRTRKKTHEKYCLYCGIDIKQNLLVPEGIFKMIWLVMVILLIIFYLTVVPLRMAFSTTSNHPFINGDKEWYALDVFSIKIYDDVNLME